MKKTLFSILLFIVFCSCNQKTEQLNKELDTLDSLKKADSLSNIKKKILDDSLSAVKKLADSIAQANASDWDYGETKDEMTGAINKWASIISTDVLQFDFPYEGGSILTLTIRKRNGANDAILRISEGQFLTYNQVCKLKFDDEKPMSVSIIQAADYSSEYIFLGSARTIMNKLKKSNTLIVEVPFHKEGRPQVHFNVKNLKWD